MRIEIWIDVDVDIEDITDLYCAYYEDTEENMDENVNQAIEDYITNTYHSDILDLLIERDEYDKIVEEVKKSIERKKQCLDKLFM